MKSSIFSKHLLSLFTVSVRNEDSRPRKILVNYLEVVNYFLKKSVTYQATAEKHVAFLRYVQQAKMIAPQIADVVLAKACNVADVYD